MHRNILTVVFLVFIHCVYGQNSVTKKPEYVIILNNEIVSKDVIDEYGKKGLIGSISKGVSQLKRDSLFNIFGEKIGEKEFIVLVTVKQSKNEPIGSDSIYSANNNRPPKEEFKIHLNDLAPDFIVELTNDEKIRLNDLRGKVVLINFWATWCAPCIMEFYDVPQKLLNPFKNEDFIFLPIAVKQDKTIVKEKLLKFEKDGVAIKKSGFDPIGKIWDLYAIQSIPKNVLIDKEGKIRFTSTGNTEGNLDKIAIEIRKLLDH